MAQRIERQPPKLETGGSSPSISASRPSPEKDRSSESLPRGATIDLSRILGVASGALWMLTSGVRRAWEAETLTSVQARQIAEILGLELSSSPTEDYYVKWRERSAQGFLT